MADWKQITARIRRARGSKDPAGQLTLLFEKTKDAMVAFELGRHFEVVRDPARALQWYQTAAAKFRRGDWKSKASEAVVRLGGEAPAETASHAAEADSASTHSSATIVSVPEPELPFEPSAAPEPLAAANADNPTAGSEEASQTQADKKRRRRGRRGGRNRNKRGSATAVTTAAQSTSRSQREARPAGEVTGQRDEIPSPRAVDSRAMPRVPVEPLPEPLGSGMRGRFGDPGLSSRLSLLEMQLRRLLTCPAAKLDHSEHAPAGPGVFVLTDDDMTTYYYVQACDTLRVAIASLARSGSAQRGGANLKALLAEHLGIPEARVAKYLADHCAVRWLQLDEGAAQFAHFAIAVLRPILNE